MVDRRLSPKTGSSVFGKGALAILLLLWTLCLPLPSSTAAGPADAGDAERLSPAGREREKEPEQIHELLFRANQAYLEGQYPEAARAYESLLEHGRINGHVLYNLGNSYIRMGEIGRAVLQYRKASLLLPRDGDLKANLQYARSLRQDRLDAETDPRLLQTLAFWYHGMNLKELLFAFLVLHALFWCAVLLRLYGKREWILWTLGLCLLLSLATGVSAALKYRQTLYSRDGVILSGEVRVRAGFTRNDTVLYVLHEGTEFSILGGENGWWKIELRDGKKGWIPAESAGRVGLGAERRVTGG